MKQRLSLACALLTNPDLILLDEPTSGLDPAGMRELVSQGKTIFLASHMLHEVEHICHRVAVLNRGELLAQGPVNELVRRDKALRLEVADLQAAASRLASLPKIGPVRIENGYLLIEATLDGAERISAHLAQDGRDFEIYRRGHFRGTSDLGRHISLALLKVWRVWLRQLVQIRLHAL